MRKLNIGDTDWISKKITAADVRLFSELSLDKNPVHLDEEYAKTTIFKKPIAHGLYVSSFISAVIANRLPGPGSIYLEQSISFRKPVFIGDTITAQVKVIEFPKPTLVRLSTVCMNQDNVIVIEGTALIKVDAAMTQET